MSQTLSDMLPVSSGWDGLTFLPSEEELRAFGFTDHVPAHWYWSARVGSAESINITVDKTPVGEVDGKFVYAYKELVMDEYFGQPAFFGNMKAEFRADLTRRLHAHLQAANALGLTVAVNPREYCWEKWPENSALTGDPSELELISKY